MHAVIVNVTINDPDSAVENLKSNIVPRVSQTRGFVAEMVRQQEGTGAATIDSVETYPVVANA